MGLSLDILGSIICGYWCARIIQFILTDLFSNTLTSIVLCISMVYLTFYIGKEETDIKNAILKVNFMHLKFFFFLNPVASSQPLSP